MTHVESLFRALESRQDRTVLVDAHTDRSVSATEFAALIRRLASALGLSCRPAPGDVVAIVAPATVEGLAARYAAAYLGCATVYCPGADNPDRLAQFIDGVDADVVVVFPETVAALLPTVFARTVVSVGTAAGVATDLLAVQVDSAPSVAPTPVRPTDACVFVASGGTTGVSKASRRDWISYASLVELGPCPERRQLICTPLAYIAQILVDSVLIGGGVVVLRRPSKPQHVLASIAAHRITHLTVVEPQLIALVDCDALPDQDLSAVEAISHVGCDLAPSLRRRLLARLGRPVLANPYGASEFGVLSMLTAPDYSLAHPELLDSSGRVMAGVDVRVVNGDGSVCGPGESGVLQVRSAAVAQGYGPTTVFGADGWFDTHDTGTIDSARYVRIRGRAADARIINGTTVFPSDIQNLLCAAPGVLYAVAIPAPEPHQGFGVAVTLSNPEALPLNEVPDAVTAIVVVDAMPTTEQGKPNRRALAELLWPVTAP